MFVSPVVYYVPLVKLKTEAKDNKPTNAVCHYQPLGTELGQGSNSRGGVWWSK